MIHPLSDVLSSNIGNNTFIWQYVVVLPMAQIGSNCNICSHCLIENDVFLGNNVTVKSGVQLWDGLHVEDNVMIGPNVTFTNDLVPRSKAIDWQLIRTRIRKGASIGANATIIAGNTIGEYSLVGAGSVVTQPIPAFTLWYGNPAKHQAYVTKEGVVIRLDLSDEKGNKYFLSEEGEPVIKEK